MESVQARREAHIFYISATIAGFLGIFPIVNSAHVFGSAQTANLIEFVTKALAKDAKEAAFHAAGALLYALAIVIATVLPKHTKANCKIVALLIDALASVVMWLFPKDLPALTTLYPTFFAMAFHWCAFKGAYGFTSANIFSSNNLRQFVSALTEIICNKDASFSLKAVFYGATLLSFHIGVVLSYIGWRLLGNVSFLCSFVPISIALCLIHKTKEA